MKNKIAIIIISILGKKFIEDYLVLNYPLQQTTKIINYNLVKVKKGKIRQYKLYDNNNKQVYNFILDKNQKLFINP